MPRKTIKKSEEKAPKKTSKKSEVSQKISSKRKTNKQEESLELSNPASIFNSIKSINLDTLKNIDRKKSIIALSVIAVLGLGVLASKYLVVAWVDNKPITRIELYQNLESRYGKDAKEEMIVEKLVLSEASKRNMSATDQEVDAEIKKLEEQQGGADQLNQILEIQGISQNDFKKLVKLQILRQKMFSDGISTSDEDVEKYIQENQEQFAGIDLSDNESSETAELKSNVKEQLNQQKINQNFNSWLQEALQSQRVARS